jgi:hypothetical protein
VSIQPNAFASVPANQAQFVHIALSIPAGTTLGTYDGTIHLRSGSTTYPQTVKVTVNVWKAFRDDVVGFSVKLPAGFSVSTTTNERPNFLGQITITGPTEGETIDISKYSNADSLSLEQWYERTLFSHEYTGTWSTLDPSSTLVTAIVLNGQPALQVISEVFGYRMKRTFIAFGPTVIEFEEGFPRDEGESSTTVKLLSTLRTM